MEKRISKILDSFGCTTNDLVDKRRDVPFGKEERDLEI